MELPRHESEGETAMDEEVQVTSEKKLLFGTRMLVNTAMLACAAPAFARSSTV